MSVSTSKQLKKLSKKNRRSLDASALDIDPDFQPIFVASIARPIPLDPTIAQQLIKIQQALDKLLTVVSGIHTHVDDNSDDIEQLNYRNSEL